MYTINQFCESFEISRRRFDILKAQGLGPQLTRVNRRVYISRCSALQWVADQRA
jgi:hypothetical protein